MGIKEYPLNLSLKSGSFYIYFGILIGTASFFTAQSGLHINDNIYRVVVTMITCQSVTERLEI